VTDGVGSRECVRVWLIRSWADVGWGQMEWSPKQDWRTKEARGTGKAAGGGGGRESNPPEQVAAHTGFED
jgi:hypothetical protein